MDTIQNTAVPRVAVGAVVLRGTSENLEIVFVRRARPPLSGTWTLPGGKLHFGELLADGVRREVLEETGLDVSVGPLLEVVEIATEGFHYVILDYLAFADGRAPLQAGDDAAEVTSVPVRSFEELELTDDVRRIVRAALQRARGA